VSNAADGLDCRRRQQGIEMNFKREAKWLVILTIVLPLIGLVMTVLVPWFSGR
jgi:hypothetical protein